MPASSRKRNKGKDRKAKKEESEKLRIRKLWVDWLENTCDHGCAMMISDDHPVSSFMDQLMINAHHKGMYGTNNLSDLFETHTQIWNDERYRKLVLDILIRIGTNMMLHEGSDTSWPHDVTWPVFIAQSIMVLEHYNGTTEIDLGLYNLVKISNWRDVGTDSSSSRRGVLKFFRKRTKCKCLKKMHLEARKSTLKMGVCYGCLKEYERAVLSVCSRCNVDPYCSRECQVAAWPEHKRDCDITQLWPEHKRGI